MTGVPLRTLLLLVRRMLTGAAAAAALTAVMTPDLVSQTPRPSCESCHGDLEFLRQHVATLAEAQALLVPASAVAGSAHASLTCVDCHEGFRRFPHPVTTTTRSCASCHEATAAKWREGVHALDDAAPCITCHGVHSVATVETLRSPRGVQEVRAACAGCHFETRPPPADPHTDSVSCAGCHEPHANFPPEDERATVHALNQAATCGRCHEEVAAAWSDDVHATAVTLLATPGRAPPPGASRGAAPSCTACHGAHGMLHRGDEDFPGAMMERCAQCHEPYRRSFADSYHGQATILGSGRVATCHSCHAAHGIHPASDPRSTVHEANLLGTCQSCHANATVGFTLFQPHADHYDRERYPYVYWSYRIMMTLLVGTFAFFGLHTLLWIVRLGIDALRGTPHAAHGGDS